MTNTDVRPILHSFSLAEMLKTLASYKDASLCDFHFQMDFIEQDEKDTIIFFHPCQMKIANIIHLFSNYTQLSVCIINLLIKDNVFDRPIN